MTFFLFFSKLRSRVSWAFPGVFDPQSLTAIWEYFHSHSLIPLRRSSSFIIPGCTRNLWRKLEWCIAQGRACTCRPTFLNLSDTHFGRRALSRWEPGAWCWSNYLLWKFMNKKRQSEWNAKNIKCIDDSCMISRNKWLLCDLQFVFEWSGHYYQSHGWNCCVKMKSIVINAKWSSQKAFHRKADAAVHSNPSQSKKQQIVGHSKAKSHIVWLVSIQTCPKHNQWI